MGRCRESRLAEVIAGKIMKIPRRRLLQLAAGAALAAAPRPAAAQAYPAKPVRVIVPFAPAGPADIVARLLAQKLTEHLGRQFYVENQPGAGGNLGMGAAARAAPDGHTLVLVSSSYMVNPSLYPKVPYDIGKDFAPITLPAFAPNVLVANPSLPTKSAKELAELIKANPGKYSFASAGMGTTPYLSGELFKLSLGADLVHVPFNGSAPAIQSTLGGHTPFAFVVLAPAVPQIKEGKLRGLAVLSAQRSTAVPDVPTIAEAGFAGQEADTLLGVLAPAGTPKAIVDMLHAEIVRVVRSPDVRERLDAIGFVPVANSPDEFATIIRDEAARWAKVVRAANIKAE
jgi:tripartite-type tricarboxylate transporter receptor subunit TctC